MVKKGENDKLTIITGGITLPEALKAAEELENIRVIDIFSVKPLDRETIVNNANETEGRVLVVEDHYPEGGIRGKLWTISRCGKQCAVLSKEHSGGTTCCSGDSTER